MNVYLIRTGDVDDDLYTGVNEFLKQKLGPFNFYIKDDVQEISISDEVKTLRGKSEKYHKKEEVLYEMMAPKLSYVSERDIVQYSWADLLSPCKAFRKRDSVSDKDVVINLTSHGNYHNWFTGFDEKGAYNYFVTSNVWDYYTDGDCRYPIAYLISSLLLKQYMFDKPKQALDAMHKKSRGCMLDFCEQKHEIMLKMRTADICNDCQTIITNAQVPFLVIRYTLDIMEDIRRQLLMKDRYGMLKSRGTLLVKGYQKNIYVPEMGMLKINLTPLERAVYLLFLNHPEGIRLSEMGQYKSELTELVNRFSRSDDQNEINQSILSLCQIDSNSLSEKLARIRQKFNKHLGEEMAAQYLVLGPNGGLKKIEIDRSNVSVVH
jgi:hypothetical protein